MRTPVDFFYRDEKGIQHLFGSGRIDLSDYHLPKEVREASYVVISGTYSITDSYKAKEIIQWSVGLDIHVETIPLERRG